MVPGDFREDELNVFRWLVFNLGLAPSSRSQIESDESTWRRVCNTKWHNESPGLLQNVLNRLLDSKVVEVRNELFQLGDLGKDLWVAWFKPKWEESFEYSYSGVEQLTDGILIRVAGYNAGVILRVIMLDLSAKEYGYVDISSITQECCTFSPLYWKELNGLSLTFLARVLPRSPHDFAYSMESRQLLRWHLQY